MTDIDAILDHCLEAVAQSDGASAVSESLTPHRDALLRSEPAAATLVRTLATVDATRAQAEPPALEVLTWLLDEARRQREDGKSPGAGFLDAAASAIEALTPGRVTQGGLLALGRAYARAGLEAPGALVALSEQCLAPSREAMPALEDLGAQLRDVAAEYANDPYGLHELIAEMTATLPAEGRAALVGQALAGDLEPPWQTLALYWLLDADPGVRRGAAEAIARQLGEAKLPAGIASMLPLVRSWMPDDDARATLEPALRAGLRSADADGATPGVHGHRIERVRGSLPDGVGAQYFVVDYSDDRGSGLAMVLTKAGFGVRDAYVIADPDRDQREGIERQLGELAECMDIIPDTLHRLLADAVAENAANGTPPPHGLVDVVRAGDVDGLHPQPLDSTQWRALLDPEKRTQALSPQKRGRLLRDADQWLLGRDLTGSWFEDDADLAAALAPCTTVHSAERAVRRHLDARRDFWARQCLRTAAVLQHGDAPYEAVQGLMATAEVLHEGREIRRIPLMERIAQTSLDASAEAAIATVAADPLAPEESTSALAAILENARAQGGWDSGVFGIYGFLFAVATHPQPPAPSEWMARLLRDLVVNEEDATAAITPVMEIYNGIVDAVTAGAPELPAGCELRDDPMANFWPEGPVGAWSRGFLAACQEFGHLVDMVDDSPEDDELANELHLMTLCLQVFSDRADAERFCAEERRHDPELSVDGLATLARESFMHALGFFATVAPTLQQGEDELWDASAPQEPVRVEKHGRNEPCPCGSGRKYKRCCGDPRKQA